MIKKRTRPQLRVREKSPEEPEDTPELEGSDEEEDNSLPLSELIELRRLRKARQGIDVQKLSKGDAKRRKRRQAEDDEPEDKGGLRAGAAAAADAKQDDEETDGIDAKARRAVRTNNFTQQTNALDVDKHMMAYIEENLKIRSRPLDPSDSKLKDAHTKDEISLSERWKLEKRTADEGSVTNSLAMLTAIPEVDLGMDTRLKNIEETEKAKRQVAEERKDYKRQYNDEEHLVASRCTSILPPLFTCNWPTSFAMTVYRPHIKQKSDAEIMRDAKLEAMGLPPQEDRRPRHDRPQMATDEVVMERFKKRMRR
ncbi:hepatocellular carcinoma-associated antigen 59-domain-containing protein [Phlebopus sp. FC_14]|nr:hepatocellular carcinoma-associated antigen 59-domain-containing protein [Phlebopus sp. FC_14]